MQRHFRAMTVFALGAAVPAQGWTRFSPTLRPPGRGYHALACDVVRGVTVVFGGWNGTPFADTWEWNGANWTQRAVTGPSARCCHALAYSVGRGSAVLFGGTSGNAIDLGDTWEYDGVNWTQRLPVHSPTPRREVRMAGDLAHGNVVLFGGGVGGQGVPVFADTWLWDGLDWTLATPATSPPARWSQGMTCDLASARVVMFGGANGGLNALDDTWLWDGSNWIAVAGPVPPLVPPQTRTALAYDYTRDVTVQFGGTPAFGQTWLFDGGAWRRDLRAAPSARESFALADDLVRSRVVLFGGASGSYLDDTWEYDSGIIARWTAFGAGCAGTAGTPLLRPATQSLPVLGSTFTLELSRLPTSGIAAISIGFSDQQWNGQPLPFALGAIGMTGCSLFASPDFLFIVTATAGSASLPWPLPGNASLAGMTFFDQGFALDPGANALGAIVANAGKGVLGPF